MDSAGRGAGRALLAGGPFDIFSGDLEQVFHVEERIRARKDAELAAYASGEEAEDSRHSDSGA